MRIECTRHVDASEPNEDGAYDYHYEYDIYRFSSEALRLVARSYVDEADEAHFLNVEDNGSTRLLRDADLNHQLFVEAAAHLRAAGKLRLRWLSGRGDGYEPVP
ncbi:hypothetical protein [Pseudomonas sp. Gutcm_11s]|uniref:hypothetical protein n=1 Tax=Pseudomonas sp. Gutcm_11s TaxID=3026088 RepID=UPI00235DD5B9|nr:hypothetical protein [Pseudomonas sp. Gutcm_11s]MDD0842877.1 hypothetical protein [Pseudomonas sp. Gutcm_11s]